MRPENNHLLTISLVASMLKKEQLLQHIGLKRFECARRRMRPRADQMSNQQLDEFEQYQPRDDAGAFKWPSRAISPIIKTLSKKNLISSRPRVAHLYRDLGCYTCCVAPLTASSTSSLLAPAPAPQLCLSSTSSATASWSYSPAAQFVKRHAFAIL